MHRLRSTRVLLAGLALMLLAGAAGAQPAYAVKFGTPDGNAHPSVGLEVFYDSAGAPLWRCSGTLLSATVFLTAGHCTDGAASAQVWFQEKVSQVPAYPYSGGITGTPYTHPSFIWRIPNTSDVGVIVLSTPATHTTSYGQLPALGALDTLATQRGRQNVSFTVAGYGLQGVKPRYSALRDRMQATVQLVNLRSALTDGYNIQHTNAPGTGGGTCFGDSGGPVFFGTSNVVAGITSFVMNENCAGSSFAYRTDIANTLNWVNGFLN